MCPIEIETEVFDTYKEAKRFVNSRYKIVRKDIEYKVLSLPLTPMIPKKTSDSFRRKFNKN